MSRRNVCALVSLCLLLAASAARADCRADRNRRLMGPAPAPAPDFAPAPAPSAEATAVSGSLAPVEEEPVSELPPLEEDQTEQTDSNDNGNDSSGDLTIQEGSLATQGPVPPVEFFNPPRISAADRGTCNLKPQVNTQCDSGMGAEDGTLPGDYQLLADPDQVEKCGTIPLTSVVQSISDWVYQGKWGGCGVKAFTTARVCVGQGPAAGRWRARILVYPDSDDCKLMCVKMTGAGSQVDAYGRSASC